jgi:anti-sigma-K factor RskA
MTGQGVADMLNEDDIALAGEYVLGVLDAAEHDAARARIAKDAAFAAEVAAWEQRLNPLLNHPAETPAPHVFDRISASLPAPRAVASNDNKQSLRWWQGISGAAIAASLVMAVMLFNTNTNAPPAVVAPAPSQILVAAMGTKGAAVSGPQAMTARYDAGAGELLITPVAINTKKLYPELWIINPAGEAKSLGMLAQDRPSKIIVSPALRDRMAAGSKLAVTAEPIGGAPDGKATGPVVVIGDIQTI